MAHHPKVYRGQGGSSLTVASGGTITAASGSTVTLAGTTAISGAASVTGTIALAGTTRTVEAHTAGDTLLAAESGSVHTSVGASGTITLVLPAATVGQEFYFYVGAAQELRLDPNGTETISLPSTGVPGGAGKYLTANLAGESVHLVCCVAGSWAVFGFTGTWTAEP